MSAQVRHTEAVVGMMQIPDDSIDSIVTSPPYADARGTDYDCVGVAEYPLWTERWATEALRITKHSLMLNIGRIKRGGEESDYFFKALAACRVAGWKWVDTIIWEKENASPLSGDYLIDKHEYVFWLARTTAPYRGYDDVRKPYADNSEARVARSPMVNGKKGAGITRQSNVNAKGGLPGSVFTCPTGAQGNAHPAPMPIRLAQHLVLLSTPLGGTVLDPFAGSGTTGVAAEWLGRDAVLLESDAEWVEYAQHRLLTESAPPYEAEFL